MSTQFPGVQILKLIKKLFLCRNCQDSTLYISTSSSLSTFNNKLQVLLSASKMFGITLGDFSSNPVINHSNMYNSF